MRIGVVIAMFLALAACSKSDDTRLKQDMRGVGTDLKAAASSVRSDPDIKAVGAEGRRTAEDAAIALKNSANDAKAMAQGAAHEAKTDADQAAHDTRHAADDVRHNAAD